jgi:hypothetical protein
VAAESQGGRSSLHPYVGPDSSHVCQDTPPRTVPRARWSTLHHLRLVTRPARVLAARLARIRSISTATHASRRRSAALRERSRFCLSATSERIAWRRAAPRTGHPCRRRGCPCAWTGSSADHPYLGVLRSSPSPGAGGHPCVVLLASEANGGLAVTRLTCSASRPACVRLPHYPLLLVGHASHRNEGGEIAVRASDRCATAFAAPPPHATPARLVRLHNRPSRPAGLRGQRFFL